MTSFKPAPGLDEHVAVMVGPAIGRLAQAAADAARAAAPADKQWISLQDERVRPEHAEAHGQTVPENLRFTLSTPRYEREHDGYPAQQMAREPRDPNLSDGLRIQCRCNSVPTTGLAADITAEQPVVAGTQVRARVTCVHHLAVTAEFGTSQDQGARYMAAGLREAGRHLRR